MAVVNGNIYSKEAINVLKNVHQIDQMIQVKKEVLADLEQKNKIVSSKQTSLNITQFSKEIIRDIDIFNEYKIKVMKAIDTMEENEMQIIHKIFFEDKTMDQIVVEMFCSERTVYRRERAALRNIGIIFEREGIVEGRAL
jgi:DNA-directed RNA polymerase specialized sigma subunit